MEPTSPDSDALAQHGQFVRQLARRLMRDEHEADDVAQGAWVRYFESDPRGVLDPRGWFAAVIANLVRNSHRSRERRAHREALAARTASTSALDDDIAQASALRSVVDAVLALDEPYRGTILARYFKNWEPARIARETGVPVATVKSRLQRAHAHLRTRLEREFGGRESFGLALGAMTDAARFAAPTTTAAAAKIVVGFGCTVLLSWLGWILWNATDSRAEFDSLAIVDQRASSDPGVESNGKVATVTGSRSTVPESTTSADSLRVSGVVRDRAYEPLDLVAGFASGVEVTVTLLRDTAGRSNAVSKANAVTDSSGAFEIELAAAWLPGDRLRVFAAESERYRSASSTETLGDDTATRAPIELVRSAHGLLSGQVVDPNGQPLAEKRVALGVPHGAKSAMELISDASGDLRVEWRGMLQSVESLDARFALLAWEPPTRLDEGGQSGLRIVLANAAELTVRVVDLNGRGLEKIEVSVDFDPSEQRTAPTSINWNPMSPRGTTDGDGRVRLDNVWSEHKLRVSVAGESSSSVRGSWLSFDPLASDDEPLVLTPGSSREIDVVWRTSARIRGRVLTPERLPIADANVELFDGVDDSVLGRTSRATTLSDEKGEFELVVRHRELSGLLRLSGATSTRSHAFNQLGYSHTASFGAEFLGCVQFDATELANGELEFELVLEPTLGLSGIIIDRDGKPLDGKRGRVQLSAAPTGASSYAAKSNSAAPEVRWGDDGAFEIVGLTRGTWDLFATRVDFSFYSWPDAFQAFRGFEAGTRGHELRYDPGEDVRITVRLDGEPISGGILVRGALDPREPLRAIEPAPSRQRIQSASDWPIGAVLRFTGISGHDDEHGRWTYGFDGLSSATQITVPRLAPGVYVIGIAPRSGESSLAPQATEPRFYAGGEYEIEFATRATTTLEGRVHGELASRRWAIEVFDSAGKRVPLESRPGSARPIYTLEVDARGRFVARNVPVGKFLLRVGTLHELGAGRAAHELELELVTTRAERVDVRIP